MSIPYIYTTNNNTVLLYIGISVTPLLSVFRYSISVTAISQYYFDPRNYLNLGGLWTKV